MKNIFAILLIVGLSTQLISCKKEVKADQEAETSKPELSYQVSEKGSSLVWTAYKTSDKVPVKGTFTTVSITEKKVAADAKGALEGMSFEIPVGSISTNDTLRDGKLEKFFFAVMKNSMTLKGTFNVKTEDSGNLNISMNGLTKELPFSYEIKQDTIHVSATMDLNNWEAQSAVESLNEACKVLHTGPDGVSKTWSEVALNAKILTIKE